MARIRCPPRRGVRAVSALTLPGSSKPPKALADTDSAAVYCKNWRRVTPFSSGTEASLFTLDIILTYPYAKRTGLFLRLATRDAREHFDMFRTNATATTDHRSSCRLPTLGKLGISFCPKVITHIADT